VFLPNYGACHGIPLDPVVQAMSPDRRDLGRFASAANTPADCRGAPVIPQ